MAQLQLERAHTHTLTHTVTTPILCLPTTTVQYPAVLFLWRGKIQEFHLPLSTLSSLLYLVSSWSSSLSVHTHTEHILVFLPDCVWFIYLCMFAHMRLRGCVCIWVQSCVWCDYMNYGSEGGGSCYNLWLQHVCWVNKLLPYLQHYNKCICTRRNARLTLTGRCGVFRGTWSAEDKAWRNRKMQENIRRRVCLFLHVLQVTDRGQIKCMSLYWVVAFQSRKQREVINYTVSVNRELSLKLHSVYLPSLSLTVLSSAHFWLPSSLFFFSSDFSVPWCSQNN